MRGSLMALVPLVAAVVSAAPVAVLGQCSTVEAEVYGSDTDEDDRFGCSAAMDGDTLVFGAYGVGTVGYFTGAAYVYERDGLAWEERAVLRAGDPEESDYFGVSVDIEGDVAVVGAPQIFPDEGNGRAYVFVRSGGAWAQAQRLTTEVGQSRDYFGRGVAIDGGRIVVGAPQGYYTSRPGRVFVYERVGGDTWVEAAVIESPLAQGRENFGEAVTVFGDRIAVGSPKAENTGPDSGAVFVFRRGGDGSWALEHQEMGGGGSMLGASVALGDRTLLAGAPDSRGSAIVFRREGTTWSYEAGLHGDQFSQGMGKSVAIDGSIAVVGCWDETPRGAAYVFGRGGDGAWTKLSKLLPVRDSDDNSDRRFGMSVATDRGRAAVGFWHDNDRGYGAGSGYVFDFYGCLCAADFNFDEAVNTLDVLAFLEAWSRDEPRADLNRNLRSDTGDVLLFLNAWNEGC